jgi:hypothetical protein
MWAKSAAREVRSKDAVAAGYHAQLVADGHANALFAQVDGHHFAGSGNGGFDFVEL